MVKDEISYTDFQKLDLRVGKVVKAESVEGSQNLIRVEVDFGTDIGKRKIFSGVAKWYKPSQLKGKKFIFLVNLAPKQMMHELSSGMILCADFDQKAVIIPVPKSIPEGTIVR
ncbi:hypothetical protein M1271_00025 [Patescibacteria group bacterium]|nr:hypothetical protein [Patescibacteria group bacterium]MCL5797207.1 hypothetical protein [Patescibacteria group bacterium]